MQALLHTPDYDLTTTPIPEAYTPSLSSATSVPYPVQPVGRPTPYFSPTPVVRWRAEVIEVSWNDYMGVSQPEWLSNIIAKLAVYPAGSSDGYITVDISAGKDAMAVAASINSDWRIYSPQKTFVIECGDGMKMYREKDNTLVGETSLLPPLSPGVVCSTFIQWAPDESIASFVAADNSVYIWRSDGEEPQKIMDHASSVYTSWSPNSLKLATVKSETSSHIGTVNVFDASGRLLHEFQFQVGGDGAILGWLTDDVLASYSRYTNWYYDLFTGRSLFNWSSMPNGDGIFHQYPQVSPDNRWVFIDQGNEMRESALDHNRLIVHKGYSLYDIQEKRQYLLLNYWGEYLRYAGWNTSSSMLYVVSRPAESVSVSEPSTPFGLLSYDVKTHLYKLLFKDAVQVVWNSDKSWAFVVFAVQDKENRLGLEGCLWKTGSTTLVGQWHISDQMVYQDPAIDSFFYAFPGPISITWSHDNNYVAVSDKFGRVKLLSVDGAERLLTDEMSANGVALRWSPDDKHLLVLSKSHAWIVNISNP
jgi:WD40 repeat protein